MYTSISWQALSMGAVYVEGTIEGADIVERDKAKVGHVSDIASLQLQTSSGSEEISARVFVNACGPWVCIITPISLPSVVCPI
jgi:hypothetical protein